MGFSEPMGHWLPGTVNIGTLMRVLAGMGF
jgi:hypothetical protein